MTIPKSLPMSIIKNFVLKINKLTKIQCLVYMNTVLFSVKDLLQTISTITITEIIYIKLNKLAQP